MEEKNSRFISETEEFYENFPDVDLDSVSDTIWQKVKQGENLSSAYKQQKETEKNALLRNEKNRMSSPGGVGKPVPQKGIYNARDVRAMTPKQVKAEYDSIIKSMGSKGFFC